MILRTVQIERFLGPDQRDTIAVVGPKGLGKTLVVKARRLIGQSGSIGMIPRNTLVDKPLGSPPPMSKAKAQYASNVDFWEKLWTLTFVVSFLREGCSREQLEKLGAKCTLAITSETLCGDTANSPSDCFSALLKVVTEANFRQVLNEIDHLSKYLRNIHTGIHIYLDNIDQFFDVHIEDSVADKKRARKGKRPASMFGVTSVEIWHYGQIGALKAARNIVTSHQHLRVHMSIRKEALDFVYDDPIATQLRGSCITLGYDRADLRAIVEKNIAADKTEFMADPLIKWVGEKTYLLEHVTTGEIERIDNYIIRHSFGRPRDLMVLGGAIANIGADRRTPLLVKSAVNGAAAHLVLTYVEECKPHVPQIDVDLAADVIDRNVIEKSEVPSINEDYRQRFQSKHGKALEMNKGILDYLFQIGLIGYVGRPVPGGPKSQIFQLPGAVVSRSVQRLPTAEAYLVHPALSDLVALRKGEQYTKNLNRFNIIGHGAPWRRPTDGYFVLNADVAKFTTIMNAGVEYSVFVKRYEDLVRHAGAKCHHAEVTEGDRTIIIDQNAARALDAAREIIAGVRSILPRQTAIRFGGDFGVIVFEPSGERRKPLGAPLRGSGRLEAKAGVGKCLVTETFITYAGDRTRALFNGGAEINMSKDNEPPEYVKVFEGFVEVDK